MTQREFTLHEVVKLLADLPGRRVRPGNVGAVVDVLPAPVLPRGYMVEFLNYCGRTYSLVTVNAGEIAPASEADMQWNARSAAYNADVDYDTFDPEID